MISKPAKCCALLLPYLPHYRKEFVELLADALGKNGCSLHVICGENRVKKQVRCVEVEGCEMTLLESSHIKVLGANIGYQKGVAKMVKSVHPDALVCLFNPGHVGHVFSLLYCLVKKIPFLLWGCAYERLEANSFTKVLRRSIRRFFLLRASGHICYGNQLKEELLGLGILENKIWVAQNTVNVDRIVAASLNDDKTAARERCRVQAGERVFLFVGALIPPKNLKALVEAFSVYVREHSSSRLYIVGDGVERQSLEALVKGQRAEGTIYLAGAKYDDELKNYFEAADVFVMPGTGGLAVNEAMAYGLPVIAAKGDGTVGDLIEHGENGFILENQCSTEEVQKALKWFANGAGRDVIVSGKQIQNIVMEKASMANMVDQFSRAVMASAN